MTLFIEVKKDYRSGRIEGYRVMDKEAVLAAHPANADIHAWSSGARLYSRLELTTSKQRLAYIAVSSDDVIEGALNEETRKRLEL